jgi:hypothetical protein
MQNEKSDGDKIKAKESQCLYSKRLSTSYETFMRSKNS